MVTWCGSVNKFVVFWMENRGQGDTGVYWGVANAPFGSIAIPSMCHSTLWPPRANFQDRTVSSTFRLRVRKSNDSARSNDSEKKKMLILMQTKPIRFWLRLDLIFKLFRMVIVGSWKMLSIPFCFIKITSREFAYGAPSCGLTFTNKVDAFCCLEIDKL